MKTTSIRAARARAGGGLDENDELALAAAPVAQLTEEADERQREKHAGRAMPAASNPIPPTVAKPPMPIAPLSHGFTAVSARNVGTASTLLPRRSDSGGRTPLARDQLTRGRNDLGCEALDHRRLTGAEHERPMR
jgi:hypothetical protein